MKLVYTMGPTTTSSLKCTGNNKNIKTNNYLFISSHSIYKKLETTTINTQIFFKKFNY